MLRCLSGIPRNCSFSSIRRSTTRLRVGLYYSSSSKKSPIQYEVKNDIAVIRFDDPNSKVNTLSKDLQQEFQSALERVEQDAQVKAAVLISNKPDCFIAGADIKMLSACSTATELSELARNGQQLFAKLLASGKPKVAAIHGSCLGGGLEVALACHYRIATSHPKTVLALPEVMLGLLPGAGGTQRLPRLVGIQKALPLLLTGKNVRAAAAKRMRLVDSLADPAALEHAALLAARQLADGQLKPKRGFSGVAGLVEKALTGTSFGRDFVFKKARESVMKQTKGHYPAPLAIVDVVEEGFNNGIQKGYEAEATRFGELGMTPESKALISIFNGQTALKKNPFREEGDAKPSKKVETIGVLGAGLMGAGIAQVSVTSGHKVLLKDANASGLARGVQQIATGLASRVKRRAMTLVESEGVLSRVFGLTSADDALWRAHFARADLVVEAVFEELALKHKVLSELETAVGEHCIVASNTSALPIADVAKPLKRPQNVLGMHYFSPVDKMPLLEIIPHAGTSREVIATAFDVGRKQGKTVIVVKDVPGFYVNRCLGPYMAECMALLQQGVDPQRLDQVMTDFGFPVGPISLADEVGIDVAGHVQTFLGANLGSRMQGVDGSASLLQSMLDNKMLGRKTGAGFYTYAKGKKGKKELNEAVKPLLEQFRKGVKQEELSDDEIAFRAVAKFVNEAIYCLGDGIVRTPADADIGAVFGIGFPPFRAGPLRYVDNYGIAAFETRMRELARSQGPQFEPAPLLSDYAKQNKKFHSE